MTTITKVTYRWDDQPGVEAGWYCETYDSDGDFREDSQKVWFPVAADDYSRRQEKGLVEALKAAFPSAQIMAR